MFIPPNSTNRLLTAPVSVTRISKKTLTLGFLLGAY